MKKVMLLIFIFVFLNLAIVESAICDLDAILLNQDPYPAVPGESVKVVFQIDGAANSDCGDIRINLVEEFPFKIDLAFNSLFEVKSGTYFKDFSSAVLVPYKLTVNKDAVEGENTLELDISSSAGTITHSFNLEVSDSRTDFEVSIKDYDKSSQVMTFEILNIGENDVEALTIDSPEQETFLIKKSSRTIVGSLDSNDDTTFDFEAMPSKGEIKLIITYTDGLNERRVLEKIVSFDPEHFNGLAGEEKGMSSWFYVTLVLVLYLVYNWYKKRKKKER